MPIVTAKEGRHDQRYHTIPPSRSDRLGCRPGRRGGRQYRRRRAGKEDGALFAMLNSASTPLENVVITSIATRGGIAAPVAAWVGLPDVLVPGGSPPGFDCHGPRRPWPRSPERNDGRSWHGKAR